MEGSGAPIDRRRRFRRSTVVLREQNMSMIFVSLLYILRCKFFEDLQHNSSFVDANSHNNCSKFDFHIFSSCGANIWKFCSNFFHF